MAPVDESVASRRGDGEAPNPAVVAEDRGLVHTALGQLPEAQRRVIELAFFEGLTQSEIATRLGISQMHVSRLLARSLAQLREDAAGDS